MPVPLACATACRWCGRALDALQQRNGDCCGAALCRLRADLQRRRERAAYALERCREAAPARLRARVAAAPVVWLRPIEPELVVLGEDERAEHLAFLERVAAAPQDFAREPVHAYASRAQRAHAADAPVCASCSGRCCGQGRARHAFIDGAMLQRHAASGGGSRADAAAWYAARLPPRHIRHSCLYHGAQGCVLPRKARAPVCNGYACEALRDARAALEPRGGAVLIAGWREGDGGERLQAGWLRAGAKAPLALAPRGQGMTARRRDKPCP